VLPGSVVGPRQSGQPRGRRQRGRRLRGGRRTSRPPDVMSAADEEERRRLLQRDDDNDDDVDKANDGGEDVRSNDGRPDGQSCLVSVVLMTTESKRMSPQ